MRRTDRVYGRLAEHPVLEKMRVKSVDFRDCGFCVSDVPVSGFPDTDRKQ